jgi:hypothetical protein
MSNTSELHERARTLLEQTKVEQTQLSKRWRTAKSALQKMLDLGAAKIKSRSKKDQPTFKKVEAFGKERFEKGKLRLEAFYTKASLDFQTRQTARKLQLQNIADSYTFAPEPTTWKTIDVVSESSYSTQGYGASSYAKCAAEASLLDAKLRNIPTRILPKTTYFVGNQMWEVTTIPKEEAKPQITVRKDGEPPRILQISCKGPLCAEVEFFGKFEEDIPKNTQIAQDLLQGNSHLKPTLHSFVAQIQVKDDVELELVRNLKPADAKTAIKFLLKKGANPMVFYPFLTWDKVKAMGLDYFGNDIPKVAA